MIRAAAKNHDDVAVVVEPEDYQAVLDELSAHKGATTLTLRRRLAAKAYARTAAYDAAISNWFANVLKNDAPDFRAFGGRLIQPLRYGENPHQTAAFYKTPDRRPGVATARQLQGRELSYNNINDTDAATNASPSSTPRVPPPASSSARQSLRCRRSDDLVGAYRKALACDSTSAYGGIVALNRTLDTEAARAITDNLHRGDHRAGRDRGSYRHRRREAEPAAIAGGRPARSARGGPHRQNRRRRPVGAEPRQRRGR